MSRINIEKFVIGFEKKLNFIKIKINKLLTLCLRFCFVVLQKYACIKYRGMNCKNLTNNVVDFLFQIFSINMDPCLNKTELYLQLNSHF